LVQHNGGMSHLKLEDGNDRPFANIGN